MLPAVANRYEGISNMTATPPLADDIQTRIEAAAMAYLDAVHELGHGLDPRFETQPISAQRGMILAMALQALGMARVHPEGMETQAIMRAFGMSFGSLIVQLGEIGRAQAIDLFNGGLTYAIDNSLAGAEPAGRA